MQTLTDFLKHLAGLNYTQNLNRLDYGIIGLYFLVLVVMGFYLKKKAAASLEDYFLAGKRMPWWLLGVSGMGNFIDMTGTMIIVSFLYLLGPRGLYVEFRGGAVLVLIFMMAWTGKWHRRSNCMTGAEWNIYRFGSGLDAKMARAIRALAAVVGTVGMLAYLVIGAGKFLIMFLPFSPMVCAAIMVGITVVYTIVSGFYGVVYTDLVQCAIIVAAVFIISIMAVMQISVNPEPLAAVATRVTHNAQWMTSVPSVYTSLPEGYKEFQPLLWVACFYLLRNVMTGMGTGGDDGRYFAARNERDCGLLTFFWTWLMTFRWPMMMAFTVLGIFLVNRLFPDQRVLKESEIAVKQYLVERARPGTRLDFSNDDRLASIIPRGDWAKKGEALLESPRTDPATTAKLAAAFGANWKEEVRRVLEQDAVVNEVIRKSQWQDALAEIRSTGQDGTGVAKRLRELNGDDWRNRTTLLGYEGTVDPEQILPGVLLFCVQPGLRGLFVVALLAAAMSTFSPTVNGGTAFFTRDIYQAFLRPKAGNRELIFASYVFGVLVTIGGFAMAYSTKNINDIWDWIIMGLQSGLALPMILRLYWWRFNAGGMLIGTAVGLAAAVLQRMFYRDLGPVDKFCWITAISLVGTIVGTFLTKPTDPNVLENFYRTTKPFGIWGHLKRTLPPEERAAMTREHRNDLLSVPFIFGWQVTLFLLPMQLIIRTWTPFFITLAIFVVCLIGVYIVWYRNLPPAREVAPTPVPAPAAVQVPSPALATLDCVACGYNNRPEATLCAQCGRNL